ncbi:tyrosine-type recombinase/integrase [Sedimenticola hydrogenitrophicus]|uniref:tyrosine-type recombinase/integrase n=1 Tax=Sedimenticola hydrogenitrophicus TaxID=2967975 RepID=UPI0023AE7B67|nr:site-specific integrase [Sedimenticola hydrogenitrophicus]
MASIIKRDGRYRAQVKVKGRRRTKSFNTLAAAREWAAETQIEMSRSRGEAINRTFGELLERYAREVSPTKKGYRWEVVRIEMIRNNDPLANVNLRQIQPADIAAWRDRRLKKVSANSVLREWNLIRNAVTVAIREWGWLVDNPMTPVKRPKEGRPRSRRPTVDELNRLTLAMGYDSELTPRTIAQRVGASMWFAIETAMRAGEIAGLRREDIQGRVARLRDTKNGADRDVPLSDRAMAILNQLDGDDLFGVSSMQITSAFRSAKRKAEVDGLTFHDMRREATSRLAKKLDLLTLAKLTGHHDLALLKNVYYAPDMEEVAGRL